MPNLNQSANAPLDNGCPSDGADKALVQPEARVLPAVLRPEPICPVDGPIPPQAESDLPSPSDPTAALHSARATAIWQHLKALKR
jgi:hypothetical protein